MSLFSVIGDVLWILALSVMASATRAAWTRISPDTTLPMTFRQDGGPGVRLKRNLALLIMPVAGFVLGLALVVGNRSPHAAPDQVLILFGIRALVAPLLAVAHLRWLKAALGVLEAEGALKPAPGL